MTRISYRLAVVVYCLLILIASCFLLSTTAPLVDAPALCKEFVALFTGHVPARSSDAALRFQTAMTVVAIEIPVAVLIDLLLDALFGEAKLHSVSDRFRRIKARTVGEALPRFFSALLIMLAIGILAGVLEEPIFRWLFCGWVHRSSASGATAFLVLALVGNAIFALIHLPNYRDRGERNPWRVLPQFWVGFWMILMLAKFGLWGAILCHSLHNFVVLLAGIPVFLRDSLRSTP